MHHNVFDRYHHHESALHRTEPRIKVIAAFAIIISNALLPDGAWIPFAITLVFILALNQLSMLGWSYTIVRSFIALPFALTAFTAIFSMQGAPLAHWNFLGIELIPTDYGVLKFFSILIRAWLSVQAAILFVAVTQFPDLIHAFEHLRMPAILTTIIAFLYRYMFVLSDEVLRLLRAREARSAARTNHPSGGSLAWRARVAGNMTGQLFLRSYERSDRIYNAMLARGYTGNIRTMNPHEVKQRDIFLCFLCILFLFVLQIFARI